MARILTAALWIVASIAYAAPSQLNYQGRLLKTDGTPEAGVVSMDFALCDSSSVLANCWARQTLLVALSDGFYSVMLSATPSDLSTSTHLSIKVNGAELWPRQPLASAPYATVAGNVSGGTVSASSISLSGGSFTVNGVNRLAPEPFCAIAANLAADMIISCPTGKVFVGPVFGGHFYMTTQASCAAGVQYGPAKPTPNVRIDDDANATANDTHWATLGCNGLNSCTVNATFSVSGVYLGTCI